MTQVVEVQTMAGNIFRGALVSDNDQGITITTSGWGSMFIPQHRIDRQDVLAASEIGLHEILPEGQ